LRVSIVFLFPRKLSRVFLYVVALHHSGHYRAYLTFQQRQIFLGVYDTIEEAKLARKEGEEKYYAPVIESYEQEVAGKR
jgi:hypothetical protein